MLEDCNTCISPSNSSLPQATSDAGSPTAPTSYVDPREHQPRDHKQLPPRSKVVLHLQLQGFRQSEIAQILGYRQTAVSNICRSRRYIEAFDEKLSEVDQEFLRLKPQAYRALQNGLASHEENTGLRAAELWFKAMGYRGFSRGDSDSTTARVTAEDIALALLNSGGGKLTIEVEPTQGQVNSPPTTLVGS